MVAPPGFEPRSKGPEPSMLDRYTTELFSGVHRMARELLGVFFIFSVVSVGSTPCLLARICPAMAIHHPTGERRTPFRVRLDAHLENQCISEDSLKHPQKVLPLCGNRIEYRITL